MSRFKWIIAASLTAALAIVTVELVASCREDECSMATFAKDSDPDGVDGFACTEYQYAKGQYIKSSIVSGGRVKKTSATMKFWQWLKPCNDCLCTASEDQNGVMCLSRPEPHDEQGSEGTTDMAHCENSGSM